MTSPPQARRLSSSTSPRPESQTINSSTLDPHASDLNLGGTLPPAYASIPALPPGRTSPEAQSNRNREKQALRDTWARQDLERGRARALQGAQPIPRAPPSIEPSSHSGSSGRGGRDRVGGVQSPDITSSESQTQDTVGHRGYLPEGMDVREALARCEDPTLGWSMQFWVTIADPLTQHVFFACPASGQCSWDPPVGAFVVPRSSEGEWWELADATRSNRSYYYNTLTGKTQWTRPAGEAFVIPLGLIQRHALPARPGDTPERSRGTPSKLFSPDTVISPRTDRNGARSSTIPTTPRTPQAGPRPPLSPRSPDVRASGHSTPHNRPISPPLITPTLTFPDPVPTGSTPPLNMTNLARRDSDENSSVNSNGQVLPRTPLSMVEEGSGNETDMSDNSGSGEGWGEKRKPKTGFGRIRNDGKDRMSPSVGLEEDSETGDGSDTQLEARANGRPQQKRAISDRSGEIPTGQSGLPRDEPLEPIHVESNVRTKRLSTGLHPTLPTNISSQIADFQTDDFASKYFATRRSGMLRQRVSLERIMEWQQQPISSPILVLSRSLTKDALTVFKIIQHVMGERDRVVEHARPVQGSSSARNLANVAMGRKGEGGRANGVNGEEGKSGKTVVLEEIRWMIQLGVSTGEMRDEIYCQVIKQLTKNSDHDAVVLGFQLFCVLVNAFGPSKNFELFVKKFLKGQGGQGTDGTTVMATYCLGKLDAFTAKGRRGRALTVGEIEHASDAAFYPSVYGEPLEKVMDLQARSYPTLKVPVILPFLADGILALGGLDAEGIFRVPGDGDSVSELKSRIDRGHYQLKGIDDPHVAASLFKLWLRELKEPVIPTDLYNDALLASKSTPDTLSFVDRLPIYNRRVLLFVISFIQLFMREDIVVRTKMTPQNLALVLAPNILRTTSDHLVTVFTNSSFESKFVVQLLENLRPDEVDPDYVPRHGPAGRRC